MGLSGIKVKQKIGLDPQNKRWQGDESSIGHKLISKMGWAAGKGLGANESGIQSNIKVSLKSNNHGIGADEKTGDNWLENSFAFDSILKNISATDDASIFVMPESIVEERTVLGARHSHRAKFVRNKNVSDYETHQINNILGKPRETIAITKIIKVSKLMKNEESVNEIVDGVLTKAQNVGIEDYFALKMAQKGIKIGIMGISDLSQSSFNTPESAKPAIGVLEVDVTEHMGKIPQIKSSKPVVDDRDSIVTESRELKRERKRLKRESKAKKKQKVD